VLFLHDDEIRAGLNKVYEKLESSEILLKSGHYGDSVSISYYVMFTSAKLLLSLKGIKPKTHAGLMRVFSKEYVHGNDFDQYIFKKFMDSLTLREQADYDFQDNINKKIAEDQLKIAKSFVEESLKFLKEI